MRATLEKALAMVIGQDQCTDVYQVATFAVFALLNSVEQEALGQLVLHGPCWDGDVISKTARDSLIAMGLASRACVKGEQGFAVANYRGWNVFNAVERPAKNFERA